MERQARIAHARRLRREEPGDDYRLTATVPGRVMAASAAQREAHIEPVGHEQAGEHEERGRTAVKRRLAQGEDREEREAAHCDQPVELTRLGEVDERFEGP